MKKVILILPLFFILTGCWNYRELNTIAITTAMAIDKTDDGYEVSLLIANGKNNQTTPQEGQSQTVVYSGRGKTISRALKRISLKIPKDIYLGHLGAVVVSEEIAKDGLYKITDFLIREPESVKRFYLVIAKDYKAREIIEILSPLESFPGQSISSNIAASDDLQAISTSIIYSRFIENLLKTGKESILPTITINGDKEKGSKDTVLEKSNPDAKTRLNTIAIFKSDKLLGYTSEDESRGINIILNEVDEMIVSYKCNDGNIVVNVSDIHTKVKNNFKNNKPHANIKVKARSSIQEVTCKVDLEDNKEIIKIEKNVEKNIRKQILKGIKVSQNKYKSDVLGFGNLFYKKYPNYYKKVAKKWNDEIFPNIDIDIDVNVKLLSKGSIEVTLIGGNYEQIKR